MKTFRNRDDDMGKASNDANDSRDFDRRKQKVAQ
jgi:hypothetical protein